jgi:hypothetical protein
MMKKNALLVAAASIPAAGNAFQYHDTRDLTAGTVMRRHGRMLALSA